jgi:hypothetical protein
MKKKLFTLLTMAGVALAFIGCSSTGEVVRLDYGVEESIISRGLEETRLPDGRLKVTAHLRNTENRRIQVQVNCQFKDENGTVVDATWRT